MSTDNLKLKSKGLTIIEMMSTVAVLSIIAVSAVAGLSAVKKSVSLERSSSVLIDTINDARTKSIRHSQYICTNIQPDNDETNTIVRTYIATNIDQSISCPCNTQNQCTLQDETTLDNTLVSNGNRKYINLIHEGKTGALINTQNIQLDITNPKDSNVSKRQIIVQTGGLATVVKK